MVIVINLFVLTVFVTFLRRNPFEQSVSRSVPRMWNHSLYIHLVPRTISRSSFFTSSTDLKNECFVPRHIVNRTASFPAL